MNASHNEPKKIFEYEFDKISNELEMALLKWKQSSSNRPQFKF
jgi:hypothetical protein